MSKVSKQLEASKPQPSEESRLGSLSGRKDRFPDPMEDAPGDHPRSLISDVSREPEDARMGHGVRPVRWAATSSCREGRSGGLPRSCVTGIKRALVTGVKGRHAARKGGVLSGGSICACRQGANGAGCCLESHSNEAGLWICSLAYMLRSIVLLGIAWSSVWDVSSASR